jgi:hypothetical protein
MYKIKIQTLIYKTFLPPYGMWPRVRKAIPNGEGIIMWIDVDQKDIEYIDTIDRHFIEYIYDKRLLLEWKYDSEHQLYRLNVFADADEATYIKLNFNDLLKNTIVGY